MGDGAMVIPSDGEVRAPEDGEVCFVFDTKHAIGFETASKLALLLHMRPHWRLRYSARSFPKTRKSVS